MCIVNLRKIQTAMRILKIFVLTMCFIVGATTMLSANQSNKNCKKECPVVVSKKRNNVGNLAPGIPIKGMIYLYDDEVIVNLPLPGDIYEITMTNQDNGSTYSGYLGIIGELVIPFDGEYGDYKLDLETSEGIYVGYFSLEE